MLTGTHSEAASYEFTTLTCIPGIIHYNDTKIQLLDLPGIIEGASEGKGRGRQVQTFNSLFFFFLFSFFYINF
jgi:ribosome-interacting GTPase 1